VYISEVSSRKSEYAVYIDGLDDVPVANVNIDHCQFDNVQKQNSIDHVKQL
jgi:hypothetical protein